MWEDYKTWGFEPPTWKRKRVRLEKVSVRFSGLNNSYWIGKIGDESDNRHRSYGRNRLFSYLSDENTKLRIFLLKNSLWRWILVSKDNFFEKIPLHTLGLYNGSFYVTSDVRVVRLIYLNPSNFWDWSQKERGRFIFIIILDGTLRHFYFYTYPTNRKHVRFRDPI